MGYEDLALVLVQALNQAKYGKGKERHASGEPFSEQPIMQIQDLVGVGFALGQAVKKAYEFRRLNPEAAIRELEGAIIYLAAAILKIKKDNNI